MSVTRQDWVRIASELDAQGNAVMEQLLSAEQCQEIASLYPHDDLFRSRVVMTRHGFGRGEYKYFRYPLPALSPNFAPRCIHIWFRWRIDGMN